MLVEDKILPKENTALGGDDRTGVSALVTMVKTLFRNNIPHGPITILFTVREESGLWGARKANIEDLGNPVRGYNIDGGPAEEIVTGAVGCDRWEAEIFGKAEHAGLAPEKGLSASMIASLALSDAKNKQIYLFSKNAGQFFYAQKITKNVIGGALIGKGDFRKFDDYDLNVKVKDFSINKEGQFYDLIFTSRLLDIFSLLQNSQDKFNYLEVPMSKRGKKFTFDHALMLGGTVAFSFKGEANPSQKTANVNGTYGPLYLFEQNFKNIPFVSELFGKNVEESLIAADFKVKKNGNKTEFIFNPLSILTPGKTRNFFDIWE